LLLAAAPRAVPHRTVCLHSVPTTMRTTALLVVGATLASAVPNAPPANGTATGLAYLSLG